MRHASGRWLTWLVVLPCCLLLAPLGVKRPAELPTPPFSRTAHVSPSVLDFVAMYEKDAAEADRQFKGKIVWLERIVDSPWQHKTDESGDKYICWPIQTVLGRPPLPELVRCYVFRPEKPVIEHHGEYWIVKGVCEGKRNGIIILRNCSFSGYGGPDW